MERFRDIPANNCTNLIMPEIRVPGMHGYCQGRSDEGYVGIYIYPQNTKSVQVNFLWGKNDVKTAIEHEY